MSTPRKKRGPTAGHLLAAVVFAVVGVLLGYSSASTYHADQCDTAGIMFAGTVAYDCKRREPK